jgi:hypothetical protein
VAVSAGDRHAIEEAAELAAKQAVRDTFRLLGVDIDDQDQVNAFRADLIHARKLRKLSDSAASTALRVMVTALALTVVGFIIDGIRRSFK